MTSLLVVNSSFFDENERMLCKSGCTQFIPCFGLGREAETLLVCTTLYACLSSQSVRMKEIDVKRYG